MNDAPTEPRTLAAYQDECDTIAAYDLADLLLAQVEEQRLLLPEEWTDDAWRELDPSAPLTVRWAYRDEYERLPAHPVDASLVDQGEAVLVTAAVGAWIAANGRGLICSTNK